jgi:hypothetical protein
LKVLGLNAWGVGSVPRDATSRMEKDEDLQGMIRSTRCVYAWQLKIAWDVKNWDRKSNKSMCEVRSRKNGHREYQHFILRFIKMSLLCEYYWNKGYLGWKEAQRQGEDRNTLRITLMSPFFRAISFVLLISMHFFCSSILPVHVFTIIFS